MYQYPQFEGCEDTANFCMKMNEMFDALNRHQPNQGLTPNSKDFKVLYFIFYFHEKITFSFVFYYFRLLRIIFKVISIIFYKGVVKYSSVAKQLGDKS